MILKTLYENSLSDVIAIDKAVTKEQAEHIFTFFKKCKVFRWEDANNNCENRANAVCILLDKWNIQNGKGWAFSGYVFRKIGYLKNLWKYHVAALIPVKENEKINYYIIDPATSDSLLMIDEWATNITDNSHSFYLIKNGDDYIFNAKKIKKDNWHKRDRRNFNWTIQGLSGINGVSSKGKAQLVFNKKKVAKTKILFKDLADSKPPF